METQVLWIYVPCPDAAVATGLARELINQKLLACANILPEVKSLYFWNGDLQEDSEAILTGKTTEKHFPEVQAFLKEMHPYELPCIVGLPVTQGNAEFLGWVKGQVSP